MSNNQYVNTKLAEKVYRAKLIPKSYQYQVDYWLIGQGKNYVDAKRAGPVIFLAVFVFVAWFILDSASKMETFSFYLFAEKFPGQTRIEFIVSEMQYFIREGHYYHVYFGIILSMLFFLLGLHLLFSPYPRPVRFNRKNGLVYTRWWGKVWVTDWNRAAVKIWRGKNVFIPWSRNYRGIALRMHTIDKKGKIKERWVLLSSLNSNKFNDLEIGGDPSLLYWHWLDEYMRGASFEGQPPAGPRKKCIPAPKIGRLWLLEKLMRFRPYKFPPSIDRKADALDKQIKSGKGYPTFKEDKLPDNPFFTWEVDFPHLQIPNADGKYDEDSSDTKA